MKFRFKPADIIIICFAVFLVLFSAYSAYMKPGTETQVLIRGQSSEWIFPLDAYETVTVTGILGDTVVKIEDGNVWVESSPCENQNCTAAGSITRQGQWTACLPNKVLVLIQGKNNVNEEPDAVTW